MNKDISMKKATSHDVKTYKELLCRLNSLGKSLEKHEEWNETTRLLNEMQSSLDWTPIVFEEEGKQGLKDLDGTIIVPARFDAIETCFARNIWPLDKPIIVSENGRFGIVKADGTGDLVLPCEHVNIHILVAAPQYYVVEDAGQKSLILGDGTELIPQIAETIFEPSNEVVIFKSKGKFGLWAMETELYIEPIYDELRAEFEEPVIAEKEGHVGFLSAEDGRFISEQDYETYSGSLIGCFV